MSDPRQGRITAILNGADDAVDGPPRLEALLPLVYDELRGMAGRRLRQEARHPTLSPTELVHEAYVRMADATRVTARGKAYFFAAAAQSMRRILVDHARYRHRAKRGGGAAALTLHDAVALTAGPELDVLELEQGLERLEEVQERAAKVVECRFYGGLSIEETASALGVTTRTVDRDWKFARAWLFDHLRADAATSEGDDVRGEVRDPSGSGPDTAGGQGGP